MKDEKFVTLFEHITQHPFLLSAHMAALILTIQNEFKDELKGKRDDEKVEIITKMLMTVLESDVMDVLNFAIIRKDREILAQLVEGESSNED